MLFEPSTIDPEIDERFEWSYSSLDYLMKSTRPRHENVRRALNEWHDEYPEELKDSFKARLLRSDFEGTLFELLLYAIFSRLDARPIVPSGDNKPDFLLDWPNGNKQFIEAAVVTGLGGARGGAEMRKYAFLDTINRKLPMDEFGYTITVVEIGPSSARTNAFLQAARAFFGPLVMLGGATTGNQRAAQPLIWKEHGWHVELNPFRPVVPGGQPLQGYYSFLDLSKAREDIARKLEAKLAQHPCLEHPYIIALNVTSVATSLSHLYEVINGKITSEILELGEKASIEHSFERTGIWWTGPSRVRNLRGILAVTRLNAWSLSSRKLIWFPNPRGKGVPEMARAFSHVRRRGATLSLIGGRTCGEILGLPADWPGEE